MKLGTGVAAFVLTASGILCAECLSYDKAPQHLGEIVCIRGRILKVFVSAGGTHYLNFCENYLACPFAVVILPAHLEEIGDVRSLENRELEIDGLVKLYNGRPEILLTQASQLRGEGASQIPPLPKNYDVTEHGKFSAGSAHMRKPKRAKRRFSSPQEEDPFADPTAPN